MEEQGADVIDIGGMSTAPYSHNDFDKKNQEIIKAINIIQKILNLPISVDTCRQKYKDVLELGVEIINDVTGLKYDENMINVLNVSSVCFSYNRKSMSGNFETKNFLEKYLIAKMANIPLNKITLDPNRFF